MGATVAPAASSDKSVSVVAGVRGGHWQEVGRRSVGGAACPLPALRSAGVMALGPHGLPGSGRRGGRPVGSWVTGESAEGVAGSGRTASRRKLMWRASG